MAALDLIPVNDVAARAAEINPVRVLLMVLALPLLILGWLAGWTVRGLWLVVSWSLAAAQVGWDRAQQPREDGS